MKNKRLSQQRVGVNKGLMLKIVLAVLLPLLFFEQSFATARYELQTNPTLPKAGVVRLIFESPLISDTVLVTRQLKTSHINQAVCVTENSKLISNSRGWIAPAGCLEIIWEVQFKQAAEPIHNVSLQENLYYPGKWWLFTEWGNLLRPEGAVEDAEDKTQICVKAPVNICRSVPSSKQAPLFMIVGVPDNRIQLESTSFNLFSGHLPKNFNTQNFYRSYGRQLSYLYKLMKTVNASLPPESVDVLILGIDGTLGELGGAAGVDTYLANIVLTDGRVATQERVKHLWVAAHEMVHILGLGTGALWATESLAHYYGFKSFDKNKQADRLFKNMLNDMEHIGLLKAQQLVAQGEGQYYSQFYIKGASFWRDLDGAIMAASQSKRSLDNYLGMLVKGEFGANGELPVDFQKRVTEVIGERKMSGLLSEYLEGS